MNTIVRNGDELSTGPFVASPLGNELRTKYGSDFKNVCMASWNQSRVLTVGDKKISAQGMWVEANFPSMANATSSFFPIKRRQTSCIVPL